MNNYCNCNSKTCSSNTSKAMYSADYDALIEKLTKTRNEIDDTIKILEDRKEKDTFINNVLSSDYDEIEEDNVKEEDSVKEEDAELKKLLDDIINGTATTSTTTTIPYRYRRYSYPWWHTLTLNTLY